ncbi:MAG TPA: translation initiation factor IF-3 [Gammaproteobacteria bacterium]|nr:translation initiation factor IF-3 [Gammaproteobacteria bacterium]
MAGEKQYRLNSQIRVPEVRLIGKDGEQVGILATDEARERADDVGLDLVEISPNAQPPVCRLMDYGKFKYEDSKRKQAAKKKQKVITVKEIKFRPGTDIGDYTVKLSKLTAFLENGDKIKATMRFRGREMAHQELGMNLLKRVEADLSELAVVEQYPRMEGRQMVMVMAPRKAG